ncbi:type I-E CRISPR-associated protein Cse2/CasB [Streptomyces sp. NBC_00887]|uniref:type I-E CRISPR-associated protein Cse2/CasB n=1 Tax=Streptomyces sp. NBC_00887 TaxID=2975859 RepID=UPI003870C48F|nr:type I-E CRISPR-associated protein Cse2/CasB [Streptomyces sp. NBC_00887]WSY36187.1 type I-E CRISPR-associated protein Cse2/CasB [Streptomyces sp. NBC_00887]
MSLTSVERRTHYDKFVAQVRDLCTTNRIRADLAGSRGRRVQQCTKAHPYLSKLTHAHGARRAHYTVAALIALEPPARNSTPPPEKPDDDADQGPALWHRRPNLGATLATAAARRPVSAVAWGEKLQLLSRLSTDVLHPRLPGLADQLLQAGCRPDWAVLLNDLAWWDHDRPAVVSRWMDSFYLALPDDAPTLDPREW